MLRVGFVIRSERIPSRAESVPLKTAERKDPLMNPVIVWNGLPRERIPSGTDSINGIRSSRDGKNGIR